MQCIRRIIACIDKDKTRSKKNPCKDEKKNYFKVIEKQKAGDKAEDDGDEEHNHHSAVQKPHLSGTIIW